MAIRPSTLYPSQTDVSDPVGYPHGAAQNVTIAGDGTGYPLEATWVKDLQGFLQALLVDAGITPSDTPDKVGASQYLQAIHQMALPQVERIVLNNVRNLQSVTNGSTANNHAIVWSTLDGEQPRWRVFKEGSGGGDGNEQISSWNGGASWDSSNVVLTSVGNALEGACGPTRMVLATGAGDTGLAYSNDGATFAQCTVTGSAAQFSMVFWTGTNFVASAPGGAHKVSTDGITFNNATTPAVNWALGAYEAAQFAISPGGRLIGVPMSGTRFIYSDDHGVNWTEVTVPSESWRGIAWKNGIWYAVNTDTTDPVYASDDDGLTWTQLSSPAITTGQFARKIFLLGKYLVGFRPQGIWYSEDGETWHRGMNVNPPGSPAFQNWQMGAGGFCFAYKSTSGPTYLVTTPQIGQFA